MLKLFWHWEEVLLNQQIDGMAAGGDQNVPAPLRQNAVILPLDDGGADGGLFRVGKAQLL